MKQCLALAGLACLLATGCATGGMTAGHVMASQRAPRPTITRDYRKPGPDASVQLAAFSNDCATDCGCGVDGCCGDGSCGLSQCYGDPCDPCDGPCQRLVNGIANGGCGPGSGFCPNGQGYPEYPAFNQGPPVGQVAYPYYTTRGPRDFLRNNPPSIGPY
jgi:hypothetical protein